MSERDDLPLLPPKYACDQCLYSQIFNTPTFGDCLVEVEGKTKYHPISPQKVLSDFRQLTYSVVTENGIVFIALVASLLQLSL